MKRLVSIILIFSLIMMSFVSSVSACSCAENPDIEVALEQSQAVFSGKVLERMRQYERIGNIIDSTWKINTD